MRLLLALIIAFLVWAAPVGAQNPPTNYSDQTTPYDGTESWFCERTSATNNGECTAAGLASSINGLQPGAATISMPSDLTGGTAISSATPVMAGFAGTITPKRSGNILITINGSLNNNTANGQCAVRIRTGAGTAPVNGATASSSGVAVGGLETVTGPTAGTPEAYSVTAVITGMTLNVARWIDLAVNSDGTVICSAFGNSITAGEL
jgi:hypothetical protein